MLGKLKASPRILISSYFEDILVSHNLDINIKNRHIIYPKICQFQKAKASDWRLILNCFFILSSLLLHTRSMCYLIVNIGEFVNCDQIKASWNSAYLAENRLRSLGGTTNHIISFSLIIVNFIIIIVIIKK